MSKTRDDYQVTVARVQLTALPACTTHVLPVTQAYAFL